MAWWVLIREAVTSVISVSLGDETCSMFAMWLASDRSRKLVFPMGGTGFGLVGLMVATERYFMCENKELTYSEFGMLQPRVAITEM
jgi:hypothetical protein